MKKMSLLLMPFLFLLAFNVGHANAVPDIRGNYSGSYTTVVSNCAESGTYYAILAMSITTQIGNTFSGTATGTFEPNAIEYIQLSGTISESGQISGNTSHTFLGTGGEGTFTGQLSGNTMSIVNPGHDTYGTTCTYIRTMSATRGGGLAPSANFRADPRSGNAPLSVNFTDESTGTITAWNWNFGDGSSSNEQNPYHIYNKLGNYTVTLSVTGPQGSDTETKADYIKIGIAAEAMPWIPLLLLDEGVQNMDHWTKLLGTSDFEVGHGIAVDTKGNAYITGVTYGNLDGNTNAGYIDVFVSKYDANGNRLWTRLLGTSDLDLGFGIAVDTKGNAYITGNIGVCKYDTNGNRLWTRLLGTSGSEVGYGIAVDTNGNAYITGSTPEDLDGNTNAGNEDIFVSKYDTNGNKLWTKLLGSSSPDYGNGIAVDTNGNAYLTGYTRGDLDGNTNAGDYDIFVSKYDTNGNRLWTRLLGTSGHDVGFGISVDTNGNAYTTGYTPGDLDGNTNAGPNDIFVSKYDTNGNRLWTRLLGTSDDEVGHGIAVDTKGNAYITGFTYGDLDGNTNAGGQDIFVSKYDTNGNRLWTRLLGTSDSEAGESIAVDTKGNAYITGVTSGDLDGNTNAGGGDIFIWKVSHLGM